MITELFLSKSKMAFELPNGKGVFILEDSDIKEIAKRIWAELLIESPERVMMLQDTGLTRARQLYEVYQKEKGSMTEKLQQECLTKIVKFLSDNDYELTTLKDKIFANTNKGN